MYYFLWKVRVKILIPIEMFTYSRAGSMKGAPMESKTHVTNATKKQSWEFCFRHRISNMICEKIIIRRYQWCYVLSSNVWFYARRMTSSKGNIFRVTGPLCRVLPGHRRIPLTKASDAELWCFLWSTPEQTVGQTIRTPVIWDANAFFLWRHSNGIWWHLV